MNAWSNVEVPPGDHEIVMIDRFERTLGGISTDIAGVRTLITRFEVCHFKMQAHYRHILQSIAALKPAVAIDRIGETHPRNGSQAVQNDVTGRSIAGQQYIDALKQWLEPTDASPDSSQAAVHARVFAWLGERNDEKRRFVIMLLDRLLYRLDGYDYQNMTGLALQVMRTDICCYAFPENMEAVIRAIGQLTPVSDFNGCGTTNAAIRQTAGRWLRELIQWLAEDETNAAVALGEKSPERVWLTACLAKTIKELIHSSDSIPVPFL